MSLAVGFAMVDKSANSATVLGEALMALAKKIGAGLRHLFAGVMFVLLGVQILAVFLGYVFAFLVLPILLIWIIVARGLVPHALILGTIWAALYWRWGRE